VIPITWRNRRAGGQAKTPEMGSRYLFICLYVWLEKFFSRGDYKRNNGNATDQRELERVYSNRFDEVRDTASESGRSWFRTFSRAECLNPGLSWTWAADMASSSTAFVPDGNSPWT
jgi:hypothetical protein